MEAASTQFYIDEIAGKDKDYIKSFYQVIIYYKRFYTNNSPNRAALNSIAEKYCAPIVFTNEGSTSKIWRNVWNRTRTEYQEDCVYANYGTIRAMQSVFMASNKVSFTHRMSGKYAVTPTRKSSYG